MIRWLVPTGTHNLLIYCLDFLHPFLVERLCLLLLHVDNLYLLGLGVGLAELLDFLQLVLDLLRQLVLLPSIKVVNKGESEEEVLT